MDIEFVNKPYKTEAGKVQPGECIMHPHLGKQIFMAMSVDPYNKNGRPYFSFKDTQIRHFFNDETVFLVKAIRLQVWL